MILHVLHISKQNTFFLWGFPQKCKCKHIYWNRYIYHVHLDIFVCMA